MFPFEYVRVATIADAAQLLAERSEAKLLAGGMTLVPTLKQRLAAPSHLVDLTAIPELRAISRSENRIRIGAAVRHVEVARSPVIREGIPALAELADGIGDAQVRNRGTLGGSVANSDPGADYPSAVLGLAASVITNQRTIHADDFFLGLFTTALEPAEIIVAIEFPLPDAASYQKYRHPVSGFAAVGVFVARFASAVRVAVTGAGECAFRWTEAEERLSRNFSEMEIAGIALDESGMLGDMHTSRAHRAHLVSVFCRRAVSQIQAGKAAP